MNEPKLSALMRQGAAVSHPHKFFNIIKGDCGQCILASAIGCAMLALGVDSEDSLPKRIREILDTVIPVHTLPKDIRQAIKKHSWARHQYSLTLLSIIGCANEFISRDRAIEFTEQLGY